ncbi:hypothetical protein L915_13629 [Phytophthora nicotianae]|uniref:Uncharacterized protein n=1 Tax=Phytophthora nicotianae TaxID=4792 RepID=W2GCI3_PHYNI|nr:hypothetical protein L915_13629 [Phytophthora nicotianae]ETM40714.1 hypothetical protein L914_13428 [Phytophthora nicotianae]
MGETSYLVNNAQFTEGNGALGLRRRLREHGVISTEGIEARR